MHSFQVRTHRQRAFSAYNTSVWICCGVIAVCLGLNQMSQLATIAAAARQFLAVFQKHNVFAAVAGLQLFDLADIDNDGAMNADELSGNESIRNAAYIFTNQITVLTAVHADVVSCRFNPVDLA